MATGEVIERLCCLVVLLQLVLVLEPLGSVGGDLASCCNGGWMDRKNCTESCASNDDGSVRGCCCSGYDVYESMLNTFCIVTDECAAELDDCEHNCHNTLESYYCSCNESYQLADDNRSCLNISISECEGNCVPGTCVNTTGFYNCSDVDECLVDNGGCSHICNNTVGSYHCECYHGYRLREDGHNCILVVAPDDRNNTSMTTLILAAGIPGGLVVCIIFVIIVGTITVLGIRTRRKKSRRINVFEGSDNPTYQASNDACNITIKVSSGDPAMKDDSDDHIYDEIRDTHRPAAPTPSELTTSQNISTSQLEVLVRSRYETSEECLLNFTMSLDRPVASNRESLALEERATSDKFVMTDNTTEKDSISDSSSENEELNSSSDSEDELENPITIRPQITSEKGSTILLLSSPPAIGTEDFAMEDEPRHASTYTTLDPSFHISDPSLHTSAVLDPSLHTSAILDPSLHTSAILDPSLHTSAILDPSLHTSDPSLHLSAVLDPSLHTSDPSLHLSTVLDPSLRTSDPSLDTSAEPDPSLHMYAVLESTPCRTEEPVPRNHCPENDTYSHLNHAMGGPEPVTTESYL